MEKGYVNIRPKFIENEKKLTIELGDRFDFSCHGDFRDAYRSLDPCQLEITIDFMKTEYIDSAALGMLLVLRERAGGDHANIIIKSCQPSVQQIMDITRFDRLFKFSA